MWITTPRGGTAREAISEEPTSALSRFFTCALNPRTFPPMTYPPGNHQPSAGSREPESRCGRRYERRAPRRTASRGDRRVRAKSGHNPDASAAASASDVPPGAPGRWPASTGDDARDGSTRGCARQVDQRSYRRLTETTGHSTRGARPPALGNAVTDHTRGQRAAVLSSRRTLRQ